MEVGWRGRLYACRYTVTTRMTSALRSAAMRAILMFHNCEGQSQKTVSTDHNFWRERRAEGDSNRHPNAYQPNALPLGQTDSHCCPSDLQIPVQWWSQLIHWRKILLFHNDRHIVLPSDLPIPVRWWSELQPPSFASSAAKHHWRWGPRRHSRLSLQVSSPPVHDLKLHRLDQQWAQCNHGGRVCRHPPVPENHSVGPGVDGGPDRVCGANVAGEPRAVRSRGHADNAEVAAAHSGESEECGDFATSGFCSIVEGEYGACGMVWCGASVLCAAVHCSEICMCGMVCVLVSVLLCIYVVVSGWVCIVVCACMCVCVCVCVCMRARVWERESCMVCVLVNVVHVMLYLCMD